MGFTLDRADNDGDYCPENCRWADQKSQVNNSRKVLDAKVTKEQLAQSKVCLFSVYDRIKRGWTVEAALSVPPGSPHKRLEEYDEYLQKRGEKGETI